MAHKRGFFEALFDISFDSSIAIRVIGVLYVISLIILSLGCLALLFSLGAQGGGALLGGLILIPIAWLLYAIFIRIGLEALVASIKTSENTTQMLQIMRQQNPNLYQTPSANPPYPQQPYQNPPANPPYQNPPSNPYR